MSKPFDVSGRVALVTGGNGGIGLGMAEGLARTPAGRWGEPADFAGIAVFLAGSASDFVTGAAIPVDGGYASQG